MNIGNNIRCLRQNRGWSQQHLGDMVHVTKQTVSCWENGKASPPLDVVIEFCCIFNISSDTLLGITPPSDQCIATDSPFQSVIQAPELEENTLDSSMSSETSLISNGSLNEQTFTKTDSLDNDTSVLTVDTDLALDYIDWCQLNSKQGLKKIIVSFISLSISLAFSELENFFSRLSLPLAIFSLVVLCIPRRNTILPAFERIESGIFILTENAKKIVDNKKREYQESSRLNSIMALLGIIGQAMWLIDSYIDNGWHFHNSMLSVFLVGILLFISACTPLAQHWHAICVLLHETAPQIPTPFSLSFWKNN